MLQNRKLRQLVEKQGWGDGSYKIVWIEYQSLGISERNRKCINEQH